ncbi:MAG: hypothetical protein KBF43_05150 [Dermatophilaceae bacterium]|nr:hypothetical protein [Actinomycetales bacterium]MBP8881692.1 hypothetical protein [Dermatophilaceae bacterium]MBP9917956.1 hypothetical protein [Dermatophilaceae bacterium]
MSPEQIADLFKIRPEEVPTPDAYAQIFSRNFTAFMNGICSQTVIDRSKGANNAITSDQIASAGEQWNQAASFLPRFKSDTASFVLDRCDSTLIYNQPAYRLYESVVTSNPIKSSGSISDPSGMDIEFDVHTTDNWNAEYWRQQSMGSGTARPALESNGTWRMKAVKSVNNSVVPTGSVIRW